MRYDPQSAEPKWRGEWDKIDLFKARSPAQAGDAPKAYVLEMFPYPSGRLHMGHVRNYAMGAMWSPVTAGPRAVMSCTRWDGTRSECPPRTPR